MRNRHLFTLTILAIVVGFSGPAWAQLVCDREFHPVDGDGNEVAEGDWIEPDNWEPNTVPNSTLVACIPPGKTANINPNVAAEALAIFIDADATNTGRLTVMGDNDDPASLTLFSDSTVAGELILDYSPKLFIDGNVTIDGGGNIMLAPSSINPNFSPAIEGTDGSAILTLQGSGAGQWDVRAGSLVLSGSGNINVELVNNAHVVANYEGILAINGTASGNGFWIAEVDPDDPDDIGTLDITSSVSGSGAFVVATNPAAEIRINFPLTTLTGDVLIYDGKFVIQQDFDTSGNFLMRNGGTIIASAGVIAYFD